VRAAYISASRSRSSAVLSAAHYDVTYVRVTSLALDGNSAQLIPAHQAHSSTTCGQQAVCFQSHAAACNVRDIMGCPCAASCYNTPKGRPAHKRSATACSRTHRLLAMLHSHPQPRMPSPMQTFHSLPGSTRVKKRGGRWPCGRQHARRLHCLQHAPPCAQNPA